MLLRSAIGSLLSALALAANLSAHPGHVAEAGESQSLSHYLTHPDHLIVWLVVAVALAVATIFYRTILQRRAARLAPAYARAVKINK